MVFLFLCVVHPEKLPVMTTGKMNSVPARVSKGV